MSLAGLASWFGAEDAYVRPPMKLRRADLVTVLVLAVLWVISHELFRPFWSGPIDRPVPVEYLVGLSAIVALAWRRQYPTAVAGYCFTHFFLACNLVPEVGYGLIYQVVCFFAIYSAVAWARDRRAMLVVIGGCAVVLFGWIAWDVAVGTGLDAIREAVAENQTQPGLLPPITSAILQNFMINALYVLTAIFLGRNAWWQARDAALVAAQAETLRVQSAELQRQAVVDERLRIARELHDVVAHHVSVMGIQAGAARTLLDRDPAQAVEALHHIEESSKIAVSEMRGLLGALRGGGSEPADGSRAPEPTLAELPLLFAETQANGLQVDFAEAFAGPDQAAGLPLPLQLSLYRIIQEALTNVQRHSTARTAKVVLRSAPPTTDSPGWVETEVLDDGRPLVGSSGSGLGQLGMRERVTSHGGTAEIGPRRAGGYRVRVRLPLRRGQS